jgi:hypothetical protein
VIPNIDSSKSGDNHEDVILDRGVMLRFARLFLFSHSFILFYFIFTFILTLDTLVYLSFCFHDSTDDFAEQHRLDPVRSPRRHDLDTRYSIRHVTSITNALR